MRKAPAIAGAFLCSVASIAVWVKLMRHVDVVVGTGFAWFRDLTGFMWHEASVEVTISYTDEKQTQQRHRTTVDSLRK
jgi:hypothetical protein